MIKDRPKVAVLIPTFNRGEYLRECLDSILAQTLPAFQIIVINDGSTDDTKNICASYGKAIEYFELNQLGKPSAINLGLEKVHGDYVWIFDDDDVALPEALERFVEPLEKNPGYGFSYSTFNYTDTDLSTGKIGRVMYELRIPDLTSRGFLIPLLEFNFLGGAGLFARTSCYQKVGKFDPDLLRSQDYEMAVRIARHFKGIRVEGGPTFHYRQHAGTRGATQDRFSVRERQKKWLEYDQKFFSKLYRELPLAEYLPPGNPAGAQERQAIFQRMAIMSCKFLIAEVLKDLNELARHKDQGSITPQEYLLIREMMTKSSPYIEGSIYYYREFFDEIRRLARSSQTIRLLRAKVLRTVLARYRSRPGGDQIPGVLSRIVRLYR